MPFLSPKTFIVTSALTTSLLAQGPNPAMNTNMAWQMQQQNFQAQRMMQMQQQMFRQMQMQQSQMQRSMQQQMQRQTAAIQARQTARLGQAALHAPNLLPPMVPKPNHEAWKVALGQSSRWPCFDGSRLVGVAAEPLRLQGLDLGTGKVGWERLIQGKPELDPVLMGDHVLYVNGDFLLVLVDAATGLARHEVQLEKLGRFTFSSKAQLPKVLFPALSEQFLILPVFGKGKDGPVGIVYAIDTVTGKKVWEAGIPGGSDLSPVVHGDRVIVGGAGRVMALDLKTGKPTWECWAGAVEPLGGGVLLADRFHVLCDGKLLAIDLKTGEKAWSVPYKGGPILSGEGDRLVHTEMRGMIAQKEWIVGLDVKTGTKAWELKAGTTHMPWIQEGKVICNADEDLLALDLQTGKTLWKAALGGRPQLPYSFSGGTAYVVTEVRDQQRIQAIRLADGGPVWDFTFTSGRSDGMLLPLGDGFLFPGEKGSLIALK